MLADLSGCNQQLNSKTKGDGRILALRPTSTPPPERQEGRVEESKWRTIDLLTPALSSFLPRMLSGLGEKREKMKAVSKYTQSIQSLA